MADVFISYAKATNAAASRVAKALKAEGYSVWWDEELPVNKSYEQVIREQIRAARAVVVIWSEDAIASQWVGAEADLARNQGKLVQTTIAPAHMPPMPFDRIQMADLSHWDGGPGHRDWEKVRAAVSELVRNGPPKPPPVDLLRPLMRALTLLLVIGALGAAAWYGWPYAKDMLAHTGTATGTSTNTSVANTANTATTSSASSDSHYVTTWRDAALESTVLIIDDAGHPVCNGALVNKRYAISLASCAGTRVIHFRFDDDRQPVAVRRRVQGPIAIFELPADVENDWPPPPAHAMPTPNDDVHTFIVTDLGHNSIPSDIGRPLLPSEACRLQPPQSGRQRSTCQLPEATLPGAALYNSDGRLTGLIASTGDVTTIDQIRAALTDASISVE